MRSYLVVGNQTLASPELETAIRDVVSAGATDFHVVVPVEPAQKGFTWDEGEARAAARERLDSFIRKLESMGAEASGEPSGERNDDRIGAGGRFFPEVAPVVRDDLTPPQNPAHRRNP